MYLLSLRVVSDRRCQKSMATEWRAPSVFYEPFKWDWPPLSVYVDTTAGQSYYYYAHLYQWVDRFERWRPSIFGVLPLGNHWEACTQAVTQLRPATLETPRPFWLLAAAVENLFSSPLWSWKPLHRKPSSLNWMMSIKSA